MNGRKRMWWRDTCLRCNLADYITTLASRVSGAARRHIDAHLGAEPRLAAYEDYFTRHMLGRTTARTLRKAIGVRARQQMA